MNKRFLGGLLAAAIAVPPVALAAMPAALATQGTLPASTSASWQTNGTVWSMAYANGNVYLGGDFSSMRPPGAAAGTGEVARDNMAAVNSATGEVTTFSHTFEPATDTVGNPVYPEAMAASPDGKKLFVAGNFTTVDGKRRNRLAAFDTATGALLPWQPSSSAEVRAIAVAGNTVYIAGNFGTVNSVARTKFAAVTADTYALLPWAPNTDKIVWALAATADGSKVFAGGNFTTLNGVPANTDGALDGTTGATLPFTANSFIPAVTPSCYTQTKDIVISGDTAYFAHEGTGGGCYDGTYAANVNDGTLKWANKCLGATQAVEVVNGWLYKGSHAHDCQSQQPDDPDAYPQAQPNMPQHLLAERLDNGYLGPWYPDTNGQPLGPRAMATDGTSLFLGGDFTSVNNQPQQGLARFSPGPGAAPQKPATPVAVSPASGQVQVFAQAPVDIDDPDLTLRLYRDGGTDPIATSQPVHSLFWKQPVVGFTDTVDPGSTHTYRVDAVDNSSVTSFKSDVSAPVTVASGTTQYDAAVTADSPSFLWKTGEPAGPAVADSSSGLNGGTYRPGVTPGQAGGPILSESGSESASFNGQDSNQANHGAEGLAVASARADSPTAYSAEAWINTTTTSGGKIIGFGNLQMRGVSGNYDKHVYMTNDGKLVFGVYTGGTTIIRTAQSYNDGQWHHVVATQDGSGMALYVDGLRAGKNAQSQNQAYQGYWRVGGDNIGGWPYQPASNYFAGSISNVAVYPAALTLDRVQAHYTASGRTVAPLPVPTSPYGQAVYNDSPDLYWRLGEAAGPTAQDASNNSNTATYGTGVTYGQPGAVNDSDTAITASGATGGTVIADNASSSPTSFSTESWFKTTTTSGGKIIGFGNDPLNLSGGYDKHVYMTNSGQLVFGVWVDGAFTVKSVRKYNDGAWHQVIATQGATGMKLYVDGTLVGTNSQAANQSYTGYWRVGGDNLGGWPDQPASNFFAGTIDDVSVYDTELSGAQVLNHWTATGRPAPPAPTTTYATAVAGDGPDLYWRLDETSGTKANDLFGKGFDGVYGSAVSLNQAGAMTNETDKAVSVNGTSNGRASTVDSMPAPGAFSVEAWFKTTTPLGGKIIGFGNAQSGSSSSFDKHVYMANNGRLFFGVNNGSRVTINSSSAYNNGQWHHVVATQDGSGMKLYVDGVLVASGSATTNQSFTGFWRVGGDSVSGWASAPLSSYLNGTIDDVAVYSKALSATQVAAHWHASGR